MATLIPISLLPEATFKKFQDDLTIVPTDEAEEERKKYSFGKSKIPSKPKEMIPMFQIDYFDKVPYMRIPFRYACETFNQLVNRNKDAAGNSFYKNIDYEFMGTLRPHQIPVAQEAYSQLATYGTTTLCLPTGFGKTLLSLYLAGLTKSLIAVNITLSALTDSWVSTFLKCYPSMKDRIWIVGENEMPSDPVLILFMYTRFEKIPLEMRNRIGALVLDEAHLHCTIGRVPALLSILPKYVIALSATLKRDDGLEKMIYSMVGEHNVERFSENPFKMYKLKTGLKFEEEKGMYGVNYSKLVNDQAESVERNYQIVSIVASNPHRKFIVLTKTKDHVNNLEKMFKENGINCSTYFGSKKKFSDERVLIGSLSKISTGFDYSSVAKDFDGVMSDTLILAATIKKETVLRQAMGRVNGRSENPSIIYMIDKNASQARHFNGTKEMILKAKGEIIELQYNDEVSGGGVVL